MKRDEIEVKTTYEMKVLDIIEQISEGKLILDVNDHGEHKPFVSVERSKDFAPQGLKYLVESIDRFATASTSSNLMLRMLSVKTSPPLVSNSPIKRLV